ncbi:MAG: hypothetical protein WC538_21105 [Thermoanaerobaculia bacterium]|jgi:hypothetical protein
MSAPRAGSWKLLAGGFGVACLAAAFGMDVVGLGGAVAVPALGIAGLGLMLGMEELWQGAARVAFAAIGYGIAAQSGGGALRFVAEDPRFWLLVGSAVLLILLYAVVRTLAAIAAVKLPEPRRIGRTPMRERAPEFTRATEDPFAPPPAPSTEDELGAWRRRR